jgi:hypothetical protein
MPTRNVPATRRAAPQISGIRTAAPLTGSLALAPRSSRPQPRGGACPTACKLRGSGCSGSGATIASWAKGKQLVVSPWTRVFSATARAHTEAPFDISYCDLEIGSRVDNVVDQHRGPQGGRITRFPFSSHYEVRRNELLRTVTTTPVLTACASSSSYQRQIATSPHHQLRRTSGVPARPQLLQLDGSIGYRGLGVPTSQSAMQGERLAHEQAW